MGAVTGNIISVFAIVFLGFGAYKMKVLPMEAAGHLSRLMLTFTAPCLVIHTMTQNRFTPEMWSSIKQALIGGNVFYIFFLLLVIPVVKLMRAPKENWGIYRIMLTFTNNGFLGFGVTYAVFGETGLFYMVIVNVFTALYVYTFGILQVTLSGGGEGVKRSPAEVARAMVNPSTVAAALGLFIFFLDIPSLSVAVIDGVVSTLGMPLEHTGAFITGITGNVVETMGSMTTPLSMFIIGMQLGESNLRQVLSDKLTGATTMFRLVLFPLITFGVARLTVPDPLVVCILTLTAAMPCATIPVVIAEEYGKNARLAAELVAVSTFFAMFTLPVVSVALTYYLNH